MSAAKVGFAGLSHLGLLYGITMASRGNTVVGYDPDSAVVEGLKGGTLPVHEPGLDDLFAQSKQRLSFSADVKTLAACDVVFISIDVRTDKDNRSDHTQIRALIADIMGAVPESSTVVILSQVPPGFTRPIAEKRRNLYYQVETLVFGRAVQRALEPERYMVGCADPSQPLPAAYGALLHSYGCPVLPMQYESAELAKIAINMYLVSSVSTTNTLAEICENIGARWEEIAPSLRLDQRIGPHAYLTPGLGIAGGNLERDLITITELSHQHGTDSGVVAAWLRNSSYRKDWANRVLHREVLATAGGRAPTVALWGLAYKQDTHSIKNSPAIRFAEGLRGVPLKAYDPRAELSPEVLGNLGGEFQRVKAPLDACAGAEVLLILTPWAEFAAASPAEIAKKLTGKTIIDPFHMLKAQACKAAGLRYFTLGADHG